MASKIPLRTKCVRIRNPKAAIPLKEYAAKHYVCDRTVLTWIAKRKVKAYKFGGRWYVYTDYMSAYSE